MLATNVIQFPASNSVLSIGLRKTDDPVIRELREKMDPIGLIEARTLKYVADNVLPHGADEYLKFMCTEYTRTRVRNELVRGFVYWLRTSGNDPEEANRIEAEWRALRKRPRSTENA